MRNFLIINVIDVTPSSNKEIFISEYYLRLNFLEIRLKKPCLC